MAPSSDRHTEKWCAALVNAIQNRDCVNAWLQNLKVAFQITGPIATEAAAIRIITNRTHTFFSLVKGVTRKIVARHNGRRYAQMMANS